MRKLALTAAALAAVAVAVPVALAVDVDQGLQIGVTPSKGGTPTHPKIVKLTVTTTTKPKDQTPFATKQAVIYFDKHFRFTPKPFKSCSKATLDASGPTACSPASKIGGGSAQGTALGQTENLTVTAFNGPGGNKVELYVQGTAPLAINSTIEGTLKNASGQYGKKLVVPIPANLQQPLNGVYATLTKFQTTVYKTKTVNGKKVGYVSTTGCKRKWFFKGDFVFTDGSTANASTTVRCS
jgi:hypothetical protein